MNVIKVWKVTHGFTASWGKYQTWGKTQREALEDIISIALKEIKK